MRLSRDTESQFIREYLIDLNAEAAATRCGIRISARYFGNALLKRENVKRRIAYEMECRRVRIGVDADFVLSELMRQYFRLMGMIGHDWAALYRDDGAIKPVNEWPDVWRKSLVTEIHSEDTYEYSTDGVQAEQSKTWDKSGVVTKIKRESQLGIEKEIRATLRMIGDHINVKAFPVPGDKIGEGLSDLAAAIDGKISEGRIRAARLVTAEK